MKNRKLFKKYNKGSHWEVSNNGYADVFISFLKEKFEIPENAQNVVVIDLGCGKGKDVVRFNDANVPALGFDKDSALISFAKRSYDKYRSNFFVYNIEKLPYDNNTRKAFFCINVMHYVDQRKVLAEIYRTLIPGGYAFIHFNLLIMDEYCTVDYSQRDRDIYKLVKKFKIIREDMISREDPKPIPHTHDIMQLILQKP
jgi:ubiquinone/menaquinone biosynthesis C-methylase UbiE